MFFAIDDIGKNKWPSAEFPDWLHLAGFSRNVLQHFCKVPTNSEPYHDGWRYATQPYDLSIDETEELLNKSRTHG